MLKIQIWMRGTMEYSQDTILGPAPNQTQEQFDLYDTVERLLRYRLPRIYSIIQYL